MDRLLNPFRWLGMMLCLTALGCVAACVISLERLGGREWVADWLQVGIGYTPLGPANFNEARIC